LAEWRRLLRGSTTQARAVLQRVLRGRLTFAPNADGSGYDFAGPTRFDKLFSGVACPRPSWMPRDDRTGLDDIDIEDTPDVDYGRLLERVRRKRGIVPGGIRQTWQCCASAGSRTCVSRELLFLRREGTSRCVLCSPS
jgi:hypothetical protein